MSFWETSSRFILPDIRRTLVFSETFYSITLVLEGSDVIAVNGKSRRLEAMRQFYEAGVETTCFISPYSQEVRNLVSDGRCEIYTLDGRRANASTKGIVIQDGRKVVKK